MRETWFLLRKVLMLHTLTNNSRLKISKFLGLSLLKKTSDMGLLQALICRMSQARLLFVFYRLVRLNLPLQDIFHVATVLTLS